MHIINAYEGVATATTAPPPIGPKSAHEITLLTVCYTYAQEVGL